MPLSRPLSSADRDRLVALLADFGLLAIHEDDPVEPHRWVAHLADRSSRDAAALALGNAPDYRALRVETADIEDEDWAARTQADLSAVRVGRLIVAPPWDVPAEANHGIVIVIEPSRGFGTGHHQSTRLCLLLLQNRALTTRTVLDVGTGSGVLAIAAAKLGASRVAAIDIDPDSVENARENIERNGVATVVDAYVDDLAATQATPANVVVANLTGTLLARHAQDLQHLVRGGGTLIVAGFNADERLAVTDAFTAAFRVTETVEEEGWLAFVLMRR